MRRCGPSTIVRTMRKAHNVPLFAMLCGVLQSMYKHNSIGYPIEDGSCHHMYAINLNGFLFTRSLSARTRLYELLDDCGSKMWYKNGAKLREDISADVI